VKVECPVLANYSWPFSNYDVGLKNEMGGTCGMDGRQETCRQGFGEETSWKQNIWWGDLMETEHLVRRPHGNRTFGGETSWKQNIWWGDLMETEHLVGRPDGNRTFGGET